MERFSGLAPPEPPRATSGGPAALAAVDVCPECAKEFFKKGALGMHRYQARGVRRPARGYA
eukprot:1394491-Lingulodinium_polyedra.AAC.1